MGGRWSDYIDHLVDIFQVRRSENKHRYCENHDAWFDAKTGEWLEKNCGDKRCDYCRDRPETAYEYLTFWERLKISLGIASE